MPDTTPDPDTIVRFWREAGPRRWFRTDAAFDDDFRARFHDQHMLAARRGLDAWAATPEGTLGLLLLLDQFPRNVFRGTAHMYATDPLARHFARGLVASGGHEQIEADLRVFCFLPFAHSEDMADQRLSLQLYATLGRPALDHGEEHARIVERFGRFPHRNPMLGRTTRAEEQAFLDQGGFAG